MSHPIRLTEAVKSLGDQPWVSLQLSAFNGNALRVRSMKGVTADWHAHPEGDEVFIVLSGTLYIDTEAEIYELTELMVLTIPAGVKHRARVETEATMIVIDNFE